MHVLGQNTFYSGETRTKNTARLLDETRIKNTSRLLLIFGNAAMKMKKYHKWYTIDAIFAIFKHSYFSHISQFKTLLPILMQRWPPKKLTQNLLFSNSHVSDVWCS